MADGNLQLALSIKADLQSAISQLRTLEQQIASTGTTAKATAGNTKAQTDAIDDLLGKIDPAVAAMSRLDAQEQQLSAHFKSGAIDADTFGAAMVKIGAKRDALTEIENGANGAGGAMKAFGLNTSFAQVELARIAKDLGTGQFSLAERSILTLGARTGLLGSLFSATGATILGVVAILGILGYALVKGSEQQDALGKAIIASGNYAGVTRGQLDQLAQSVGQVSGRFGDAYEAVTKLVASGKITGEELQDAARSAVEYAQLTGESIDQAIEKVIKIGEDPVKAVKDFDSSLHFLTGTEYDQIKALEKTGDQAGATALAFHVLSKAVDDDIATMKEQEGTLERFFDNWTTHLQNIKQQILNIGKDSTLQQQLNELNTDIAQQQQTIAHFNSNNFGVPTIRANAQDALNADLQKRLGLIQQINAENAQAAAVGAQKRVNADYIAASDDLDRLTVSVDKNAEKQAKLNQLYKDYEAIRAHDPNDPRLTNGSLETLTADITDGSTIKKPKSDGIDRAQLSADVQAARAALQQLNDAYTNSEQVLEAQHKAGAISDEAYFQGKLSAINRLETAEVAELEQEKAAVAGHGKTAADRIRIDQQIADIDGQITKAHADAAAKRAEIDAQEDQLQQKRSKELAQIQIDYLKAIGDPGDAALLELHSKFDATIKEMQLDGNAAGIVIAKQLFSVEEAKTQLDRIQQAYTLATNVEELQSQAIQSDIDNGLTGEIAGRQKIIDLHKQTAAAIEAELPLMLQLAQASQNPEAILAVAKLAEQVREAQNQLSELQQEVKSTVLDAFSQLDDALLNRTETIKAAFADLFKNIAEGLVKLGLQDLEQKAYTSIAGLFGQGAAQSATAAAITAATATGATTMGTAIAGGGVSAADVMGAAIAAAGVAAANSMAVAILTASAGGGGTGTGGGISVGLDALEDLGLFAGGGPISGPGGPRSDSVVIRASAGEFMQNAAAVEHYGLDFMHAINDRALPRYADGGLVVKGPSLRSLTLRDHGAALSSGQPMAIRVVAVFDPDTIPNAMAGRKGEKVVMVHAKANIPTLRAFVR